MSFFVCLKVESIGEEDRIAGRKKNGKVQLINVNSEMKKV